MGGYNYNLTMTTPYFHYPSPKDPLFIGRNTPGRNLFEDYGSFSGFNQVEISGKLYQVVQKDKSSKTILCARGPTLPFGDPNPGNPVVEPCIGDLKRTREEKLMFMKKIRAIPRSFLKIEGGDTHMEIGSRSRYPTTLNWLSKIYRKYKDQPFTPLVNQDYTGGCLSHLDTSFGSILCHPSGVDLSVLSLSNLGTQIDQCVPARTGIELGSRILQVDTETVCNRYFSAVRTETGTCYTYRIRDSSEGILKLKEVAKIPSHQTPTSIFISPYIERECVTATADGQAHFWDGSQEVLNISTEPRFACPDTWISAHFGSHPREVVVTDRTGSTIWDLRSKPRSEDLFVLPSRLLRNEDRIMMCQRHPSRSFYHILATEETLMMVDERFPINPALLWRHSFIHPPQYMCVVNSILSEEEDDVILLASQEQPEIHCFQIGASDPQIPPRSTCAPWRIPGPEDMYNLYKQKDLDMIVNQKFVEDRLGAPLVGIAAGRSKDRGGLYAIQMTSYGDMFYQEYVKGTLHSEKNWASGPGSNSLKLSTKASQHVEKWLTHLTQNRWRELSNVAVDDDAKSFKEMREMDEKRLPSRSVNQVFGKLISPCHPHPECQLCQGFIDVYRTKPKQSNKSAKSSGKCFTCGMTLDGMGELLSDIKQDRVFRSGQKPNADQDSILERFMKRTKYIEDNTTGLSDIFFTHWGDVSNSLNTTEQASHRDEESISESCLDTTDYVTASTSMSSSRSVSWSKPVSSHAVEISSPRTPKSKTISRILKSKGGDALDISSPRTPKSTTMSRTPTPRSDADTQLKSDSKSASTSKVNKPKILISKHDSLSESQMTPPPRILPDSASLTLSQSQSDNLYTIGEQTESLLSPPLSQRAQDSVNDVYPSSSKKRKRTSDHSADESILGSPAPSSSIDSQTLMSQSLSLTPKSVKKKKKRTSLLGFY